MKIFPDHSHLITRSPGPEIWSWIKYFGRIATDGGDPEVVVYGWETFQAGLDRVGHITGTDGGTVCGYVQTGRAIISTKDDVLPIAEGTFFVARSPVEVSLADETVVVAVENKAAEIQIDTFGGPVKIDGTNGENGIWIQTLFSHPWNSFPQVMRIHLDPGVREVFEISDPCRTRVLFIAGGEGVLHAPDQDVKLDPGLIVVLKEGQFVTKIVTDQGLDLIVIHPFKARHTEKLALDHEAQRIPIDEVDIDETGLPP